MVEIRDRDDGIVLGGDDGERRGKSRERIPCDGIGAEVGRGGGIVAVTLEHALGHLGNGREGKDVI